ncbi:strawberry notch-like NTP hydrolase domain-containing protein (plasmid) [Azospirillum sp. HJ39]|uniref:strawberry notch-like NTP hydrolase domain-containing protein n=1 Tax=Azospirillum sp. HJ39 TaxID=3159496 RepID=UPI003557FE4F
MSDIIARPAPLPALTERLGAGNSISSQALFSAADQWFGGSQGAGTYTAADAYDIAEMTLHRLILDRRISLAPTVGLLSAQLRAEDLESLGALLPTRSRRDEEVAAFDQFSTPPAVAFLAAWLADLKPADLVLEPSGGTGALAVQAANAGAAVVCVELSERRAAILEGLGFRTIRENADHLHSILPKDVLPTAVLMNPPFTATAGRLGDIADPMTAARHTEQALKRLVKGGRLVAILPPGMGFGAARYRDWWRSIIQTYTVKANLLLEGAAFRKAGTSIAVRIVVIDKTGPTSSGQRPLGGEFDSVASIMAVLEGVRLNRPTPSQAPRPVLARPAPRPAAAPGCAGTPTTPQAAVAGAVASTEPGAEAANAPAEPDTVAPATTAATVTVGQTKARDRFDAPIQDVKYEPYEPQRLKLDGAKPHPSKLVESAAMAAVLPPEPTYSPHFPENVILDGKLSFAQVEAVVYAGQAHRELLPARAEEPAFRAGFAIGDGTGVGKGRECAGIIFDNWCQGRIKALWITKNDSTLLDAARRDWGDLGGNPSDIFPMSKIPAGEPIKATKGIMLVSTGTLRSKPRDKISRLQQILNWLGTGFDGVIISDEHHAAANAVETDGARGKAKASQTGLASVDLQKALPNARVVYVSATLADKVENLSSCDRLGLWGHGTPFAGKHQFIDEIKAGGIAAMEIVTRDVKALGRYVARSLSYEDVRYRRLVHELTPAQVELYDAMAEAWQLVLANVHKVMEIIGTSGDAQAKSKTMSAFWGSHQRFFNQVLTAMMMPTILKEMEADLAAGRSPLLYFVNTNEAAMDRALSREGAAENLEDLDMSPRESLLQYLEMCFPTKQHEAYMDEAGNFRMRVALDESGRPIINAEADEIREELILQVASLRVPNGPLEQLLDHFGVDKVAELTGRSRRVVKKPDGFGAMKAQIETRTRSSMMADLQAFHDDTKPIAAYSNAGNTGIDLHASRKFRNQRQRVLYIAQAGWSAKEATQACGRPHRSDQVSAPEIVLCATSLKGHKRFMSSIARRLGSLGALTKGQRNTGEQGLFTTRDDLEGEYGSAALFQLIMDLYDGKEVAGLSIFEFERQLGLRLLNDEGDLLKDKLPPVKQFLNRLLSMNVEPMNRLFDEFASRLEQAVELAADAGTLNVGMETVIADSIEMVSPPRVVYREPRTGAETTYTELKVWRRNNGVDFDALLEKHDDILQFINNKQNGRIYAQRPAHNRTDADGKVIGQYRLVGPFGTHYIDAPSIDGVISHYRMVDEEKAKSLWQAEIGHAEPFTVEAMHVISGVLLPIWDKLAGAGEPRVYRLQTDDGQRILGRVIPALMIRQVLQRLGASYGKAWSAKETIAAVLAGHRLQLANGWTLFSTKVNGEQRIELTGPKFSQYSADLKKIGVLYEYIRSATRFFVPHGGPAVMDKLIQFRPVVDGGVGSR